MATQQSLSLTVYCSGPLFSPEERAAMQDIAERIEEAGYRTFLPQRDGLEPFVLPFLRSPFKLLQQALGSTVDSAIFAVDVYQLAKACELFVINLNGRVSDEGAVVECALAFALQKPIVAYKNDARAPFNGADNSMLTGLLGGGNKVTDLRKITGALDEATKRIQPLNASRWSENTAKAVSRGEKIWQLMQRLRSGAHERHVAQATSVIQTILKD